MIKTKQMKESLRGKQRTAQHQKIFCDKLKTLKIFLTAVKLSHRGENTFIVNLKV